MNDRVAKQQTRPGRAGAAPGPVRVAFVTTSMGVGGAERLLVELIRRMDRTHYEPILLCLKELDVLGEQLARAGVRAYAQLSRHRGDMSVLARLTRILRRERAAVVCTVGTGGDRSFWGRLGARCAGVPVIVSCPHSMGVPDRFEPPNRLLGAITDAYVAVARLQKQYLVRGEGLPPNKIHVVHNGVDVEQFAPGVHDREALALRKGLGIPAGAPVAGIVAYLRPEKNVAMFLRAAGAIRRVVPDAHFLVVGDGPERVGLEALARALGLRDAVHFTGLRDDVRDCLAALDVLVLTSVCEAFPVSVLEAMACARPIVATAVGAIPEMVLTGRTGYLVPRDDDQALVDAVVRMLADRALARAMGAEGRRTVVRRFDVRDMVRGYESLFARLLARKNGCAFRGTATPPVYPTPAAAPRGRVGAQGRALKRNAEPLRSVAHNVARHAVADQADPSRRGEPHELGAGGSTMPSEVMA